MGGNVGLAARAAVAVPIVFLALAGAVHAVHVGWAFVATPGAVVSVCPCLNLAARDAG